MKETGAGESSCHLTLESYSEQELEKKTNTMITPNAGF